MDNLELREYRALRKATDHLPIIGIDAMFIASLQIKLDNYIKKIETDQTLDTPATNKPPTSKKK